MRSPTALPILLHSMLLAAGYSSLATARAAYPHRRLVAVFQPHLYSRTKAMAAEFGSALALADEVRAAFNNEYVTPAGRLLSDATTAYALALQWALLPTGEVVAVKLRKSSGVTSYDNAVERAIWKSSPLPPPDRRELFEPRLNLTFRPVE